MAGDAVMDGRKGVAIRAHNNPGRGFGLQNGRGSAINEPVKAFGGRMFEETFKNIDDVLWKEAGCTPELDYTEQTSWILFLKSLDDLEQERALAAELVNKPYSFIIEKQH